MKAKDLMTKDPAVCTPDKDVREAAKMMKDNDCGSLPIVESTESRKLVGTITDRDIAIRVVAEGRGSETMIREVMSGSPSSVREDSDMSEVKRIMEEKQVRRVPVVDNDGRCIGIIAQADLANARDGKISDKDVGRVVERISEPEHGRRPESR